MASLLISCVSSRIRGIDPGIAGGICYGTNLWLDLPVSESNSVIQTTLARNSRDFCCAAMAFAVDFVTVARVKDIVFLCIYRGKKLVEQRQTE